MSENKESKQEKVLEIDRMEGILFKGVVTGRVRRLIGKEERELVTYKCIANGKDFYLKEWQPGGVYHIVGEIIYCPIRIHTYMRGLCICIDF